MSLWIAAQPSGVLAHFLFFFFFLTIIILAEGTLYPIIQIINKGLNSTGPSTHWVLH